MSKTDSLWWLLLSAPVLIALALLGHEVVRRFREGIKEFRGTMKAERRKM